MCGPKGRVRRFFAGFGVTGGRRPRRPGRAARGDTELTRDTTGGQLQNGKARDTERTAATRREEQGEKRGRRLRRDRAVRGVTARLPF